MRVWKKRWCRDNHIACVFVCVCVSDSPCHESAGRGQGRSASITQSLPLPLPFLFSLLFRSLYLSVYLSFIPQLSLNRCERCGNVCVIFSSVLPISSSVLFLMSNSFISSLGPVYFTLPARGGRVLEIQREVRRTESEDNLNCELNDLLQRRTETHS